MFCKLSRPDLDDVLFGLVCTAAVLVYVLGIVVVPIAKAILVSAEAGKKLLAFILLEAIVLLAGIIGSTLRFLAQRKTQKVSHRNSKAVEQHQTASQGAV